MKEQLNEIFSNAVDESVVDLIIQNGKYDELQKNQRIFSSDEKSRNLYIILKGSITRNAINVNGNDKAVMFHTQDFLPLVAGVDVYLSDTITEYNLLVNEPTSVLIVDFNLIQELIRENHSFAIYSCDYLNYKYFTIESIRFRFLSESSEDFLMWLYTHYPFLFKIFPSQSIASFMGITPEWLSKIKRKLFLLN